MADLVVSTDAVAERIQAMRIQAEQALANVEAAARNNAQALARVVVGYRALLFDTGSRLVQLQSRLVQTAAANPDDARLGPLQARVLALLTTWAAHAHGYAAYERPATEAEKGQAVSVGWAGVVIALAVSGAVIAVAVTGIAWAVVHYREAQTLADEVAAVEADPALAEPLAKVNQTAPQAPDPSPSKGGWGWVLVGVAVAAGACSSSRSSGRGEAWRSSA